MAEKILFVDDEPNVLEGLRRQIRKQFEGSYISDPTTVMNVIEAEGPFAAVVSDMRMPNVDGTTLLRSVKDRHPDMVRIMLTGNADQETAVSAINEGSIFSFLNKPCDPKVLTQTLKNAVQHHLLITAEKEVLEKTLAGSIRTLVEVLAKSEPTIFGNAIQLRDLARVHAKLLGGNPWKLDMAAMLAPIGWMTLPHDLSAKVGRGAGLTLDERRLVEGLPQKSAELIGNIPRLEDISRIVRFTQKNFDGSGFPKEMPKGEEVPIESRILRLLGDLLTEAGGPDLTEDAFEELDARRGVYEPDLLSALRGKVRHSLLAEGTIERAEDTATNQDIVKIQVIGQLEPGDMLIDDLRTEDGELASAGNVFLSAAALDTLERLDRARGLVFPVKILRGANAN